MNDNGDLALSIAARARWIQRALSPWVGRWLPGSAGSATRSGTHFDRYTRTALSAAHTNVLLARVQRRLERSTTWPAYAGSLQPALVGRFTSAIVERFPDMTAKYRPQPLEAGPGETADLILAGGPPGQGLAAEAWSPGPEEMERGEPPRPPTMADLRATWEAREAGLSQPPPDPGRVPRRIQRTRWPGEPEEEPESPEPPRRPTMAELRTMWEAKKGHPAKPLPGLVQRTQTEPRTRKGRRVARRFAQIEEISPGGKTSTGVQPRGMPPTPADVEERHPERPEAPSLIQPEVAGEAPSPPAEGSRGAPRPVSVGREVTPGQPAPPPVQREALEEAPSPPAEAEAPRPPVSREVTQAVQHEALEEAPSPPPAEAEALCPPVSREVAPPVQREAPEEAPSPPAEAEAPLPPAVSREVIPPAQHKVADQVPSPPPVQREALGEAPSPPPAEGPRGVPRPPLVSREVIPPAQQEVAEQVLPAPPAKAEAPSLPVQREGADEAPSPPGINRQVTPGTSTPSVAEEEAPPSPLARREAAPERPGPPPAVQWETGKKGSAQPPPAGEARPGPEMPASSAQIAPAVPGERPLVGRRMAPAEHPPGLEEEVLARAESRARLPLTEPPRPAGRLEAEHERFETPKGLTSPDQMLPHVTQIKSPAHMVTLRAPQAQVQARFEEGKPVLERAVPGWRRNWGDALPLPPLSQPAGAELVERQPLAVSRGLATPFQGAGVVQKAAEGETPASEPSAEERPGLDLDDLARQVYPLVKRMLAVERERRPGH